MNPILALLNALTIVNQFTPVLMDLFRHYRKIIEAGEVTEEDKEKAKKLLEGARWEIWE